MRIRNHLFRSVRQFPNKVLFFLRHFVGSPIVFRFPKWRFPHPILLGPDEIFAKIYLHWSLRDSGNVRSFGRQILFFYQARPKWTKKLLIFYNYTKIETEQIEH